jgi:glyceraldehyde 3-phosphate dehydrogenase
VFRGAQGAGDAIVSSDIAKSPYSPVLSSQLTAVLDGGLVKVVLRYDSEWRCANRRVELAKQVLVHAHA